MPALLREVTAALAGATHRRPAAGGFALVEHAWHLADLEREGYGARISRLLVEDGPALPDFEGDRIALEREYLCGSVELALEVFAQARARNIERLAALDGAALARRGTQEGVGELTLGRVPRMMAAHDAGHVAELAALVEEMAPGASVLARLRAMSGVPNEPALA
ncbi:MAG TPA: DinB family protein [Methylomirabilota bacterium]|nr:DinB family protein [Methylomirabilota bacterium]